MAAEPLSQTSSARDSGGWSASPSGGGGTRRSDRQGRVVQSLAHKVSRPCSRNDCPAPARASLVLDYAGKRVTLVPLLDQRDPRFLEVCSSHAGRTDVPRGWQLVDERDEEQVAPSGPPSAEDLASTATVAVLAAALRDDPADEVPALRASPDAADHDLGASVSQVDGDEVVVPHETPRTARIGTPPRPAAQPAPAEVPQPPSGRLARPGGRTDQARQGRLDLSGPGVPRPVRAVREGPGPG